MEYQPVEAEQSEIQSMQLQDPSKNIEQETSVPQVSTNVDVSGIHVSTEATEIQKDTFKKLKKRKLKVPRDKTAPRQPLTGYLRFLNEHRDQLRSDHPELGFVELTRQLANDWNKLPADEKKQYLDAADLDKKRYIKEWAEYKKSDAYKEFQRLEVEKELTSSKKSKRISSMENAIVDASSDPLEQSVATVNSNTLVVPELVSLQETPSKSRISITPCPGEDYSGYTDIPIFTEQFLQQNKLRESELRQLRKTISDYEQQNAILQRHAEELTGATQSLRAETKAVTEQTIATMSQYDQLASLLIRSLQSIELDLIGGLSSPTDTNIEEYMEHLKHMATRTKDDPIVEQARATLSRMNLFNYHHICGGQ